MWPLKANVFYQMKGLLRLILSGEILSLCLWLQLKCCIPKQSFNKEKTYPELWRVILFPHSYISATFGA